MKVENISESEQFFVSPDLPSWVRIIFNMKDLYLCYKHSFFKIPLSSDLSVVCDFLSLSGFRSPKPLPFLLKGQRLVLNLYLK